jgi:hypothetical protein
MGRILVARVVLGFAALGCVLSLLLLVATFFYTPADIIALRDWTLWVMLGLFFPTTLLLAFYNLLFNSRKPDGVNLLPISRRSWLLLTLLALGCTSVLIYFGVASTNELVKQMYIIRSWLALAGFGSANLILISLRTAFGASNK